MELIAGSLIFIAIFQVGKCDVIEQVMIGDETLLKFSGVPLGEACSIVIRGATEQILGEAERSLHDALCVLTSTVKNTKTVLGGGERMMKSQNAIGKNSQVGCSLSPTLVPFLTQ